MMPAVLLTLLALAGVMIGVLLGESRQLSDHLGAAGGGLLLGIATFWLLPEIAGDLGWGRCLGLAVGICVLLAALDRALMHGGYSVGDGVATPLLILTGIHSFLDGWSVRAAAVGPIANIAVPLGLALHKIPEGLALGWITRRRFASVNKALVAGAAAEVITLVGAVAQPRADQTGIHHFGLWWTASVLAVIAGTFSFLGLHAVWPARRDKGVVLVFLATLLTVGAVANFH